VDARAERGQALGNVALAPIGPSDLETVREQHLRDAAHTDATDTYEMKRTNPTTKHAYSSAIAPAAVADGSTHGPNPQYQGNSA
jgi:hypothetical protein